MKGRLLVIPRALLRRLIAGGRRARPTAPKRILIAHHLLFGDTLCMAPLLAKCRERYPNAEICMTVPQSIATLFRGHPFGVTALPFALDDVDSIGALLEYRGFDLALVPGENRFSWLAQAMDARWIVGFEGDRPAYKNWFLDESIPFPRWPWNWADCAATLIPGPAPSPYDPEDWPDPPFDIFDVPDRPYAVLHVGARNPLRNWQSEKWRAVTAFLEEREIEVVYSGGHGDEPIVAEIDPSGTHRSYAGRLALDQLWHLVKRARVLVCPDTGVAHLGRVTGTPTVALFGPGSVVLSGAGDFWRNSAYRAVGEVEVPCRDQQLIFKREIPGMQRCVRAAPECDNNACMQGLGVDSVNQAVTELLGAGR